MPTEEYFADGVVDADESGSENRRASIVARSLSALLRENAARIDREGVFPEENLKALRSSGLLGMFVPTELGGLGSSLAEFSAACMTLGAECLSTAMIWAMHCQQVDVVDRHAKDTLRSSLLPRVAAGEVYLASVTTEAGKDGNLMVSDLPLVRTETGWHLERFAPIVTGGTAADGFLITMRSGEESAPSDVVLVYAERDRLRVTVDDNGWDALGMRGTHSVAAHLVGEVPGTQVIGSGVPFRRIALDSMIPIAHIGWSACWIGAAKRALESVTRLYGSADRPRGFDIESTHVAAGVGRVRTRLELAHGYLMRTVEEVRRIRSTGGDPGGNDVQIHLNTLKIVASEESFKAVDELIEIVGLGKGYLRSSSLPLERVYRDLRSASLNNSNQRILAATGRLNLMDRGITLV